MKQFLKDVLQDLGETPKRLNSKYFYDHTGDGIFQQIMNCEEYYPTNCELEIFQHKTTELARVLKNGFDTFDLIEMGAGDATKSSYLLKEMLRKKFDFTYMPIDISADMIGHLEKQLPEEIPGLKVKGLNGEYFEMLTHASQISPKRKVILFLGGTIGNFETNAALDFCRELRSYLQKGDVLMIGFDLKKHPDVIRKAYNDAQGFTRAFNLNLLNRINRELGGNFVLEQFDHYPSYDPATGACRSYLISLAKQEVCIEGKVFTFEKDEYISMEISQKYSVEETESMAFNSGFKPVNHFFDSRHWFLDTVWQCE
ncbi:L-histidine N(alpha)-methyltransferase [Pedobacter sp. HMWF019]|uniref:L-histidine N(alpha)-methyltransferase n=1 Tax=Pedobacter sp. HMWF019 TaxID=2056856 RepID=UPI000D3B8645|nr:L-histidine N(alpha)-methyltransferase [Pedobacter sp. HMWF019]PTT02144.1 L-histidine N(alpha)-methyltransferase [Pedobacter sp. HMWF019]